MAQEIYETLKSHPEYHKLLETRNRIIWPLAMLMIFVYFFYVLVIAFAPDIFAIHFGESKMTLGILSGLGIILFTFILTGYYVRKANKVLEPLVHRIHDIAEGKE